jgi:hypothetical protein
MFLKTVLATLSEPMPGWIDSMFGPTAVVVANGKGIFHTMVCDNDKVVDLIPADIVKYLNEKFSVWINKIII